MGQGSYADVFLVEHTILNSKFALKRFIKSQLRTEKDINRAITERNIMQTANHPFIINLHYAFQSQKFLYYVIDFANGGELFTILRRKGPFSESVVKLYAAEIVLALLHLHSTNIIHGDLKLENLLIDSKGHVVLTDFGLARTNSEEHSVIGTREYLSPEVLRKKPVTKAVDFWALVS